MQVFYFNTLNYLEEKISACKTSDESEWESDFSN